MERKILYISSFREDVAEKLSALIRELGRKTKRPLWGKTFLPEEKVKSLLYLDSGGRGNLGMMARSMRAEIVEYVFTDKSTGEHFLLLSERLKSEYKDGEISYKSWKNAKKTLGNRIKALDAECEREFFIVSCSVFEKSSVYSSVKSAVIENITNSHCYEGDFISLLNREKLPPVIISDAFSENGVFALLENSYGKPLTVHIMSEHSEIYAPFTSLEKEIFIETERFMKEALFSVCCWLKDSNEERCSKKLKAAFSPLFGGEELIERVLNRITYGKSR